MIVLALDTATDRLSVAAGTPRGRRAERQANGARRHAALLVPLVLEALGELGVGLDQVDAVAVSNGPGSFTGLRVAAAWAKAMTRARGMPLYAASTLLVRASQARPAAAAIVLGVGTALRGELYAAAYRFERDGAITTIIQPIVLAAGTPLPGGVVVDAIVGDLDPGELGRWSWAAQVPVVGPPAGLPSAAALIDLVDVRGGAVAVDDAARWEPDYGRPAEAQARWEREHGRSLGDTAGITR